MTGVDLVPLVDEGLGNSAYLIDLGEGHALVVDVSRDLRAVHTAAAKRGLKVAFSADTHPHADFLSGALQLGATSGTQVLASAAGNREFAHTGLHDGDEVDLGGLRLRALMTPGHTHEHLAFLLLDGDRELGVFTGGSLLVGSVARTDLIADDRTEELARAQYASLRRLATLPGDAQVWPTPAPFLLGLSYALIAVGLCAVFVRETRGMRSWKRASTAPATKRRRHRRIGRSSSAPASPNQRCRPLARPAWLTTSTSACPGACSQSCSPATESPSATSAS
ncbi:glyoxylase-like metal-dependent hydrolase (beta-lactamase superfamily II) [Mycobacterium sp. AZCC_0083]|nr:glyoxylase-like metal-dependent hydrolase (beta-lactamase superfamily II) [Mycobacterium sp. AZCC_0083]